jgi:hypothetical protein
MGEQHDQQSCNRPNNEPIAYTASFCRIGSFAGESVGAGNIIKKAAMWRPKIRSSMLFIPGLHFLTG